MRFSAGSLIDTDSGNRHAVYIFFGYVARAVACLTRFVTYWCKYAVDMIRNVRVLINGV